MAGGNGRAIVELAGPEEYSLEHAAAAPGEILGRAVAVQGRR